MDDSSEDDSAENDSSEDDSSEKAFSDELISLSSVGRASCRSIDCCCDAPCGCISYASCLLACSRDDASSGVIPRDDLDL